MHKEESQLSSSEKLILNVRYSNVEKSILSIKGKFIFAVESWGLNLLNFSIVRHRLSKGSEDLSRVLAVRLGRACDGGSMG